MTDAPLDGEDEERPDRDDRDSARPLAAGLVVVAIMALMAVLVFAVGGDDDDVMVNVAEDPAPSDASPSTVSPADPEPTEPTEPAEPLGADSALVGLTEDEVRDSYVVVRVVERDGVPQMSTMDLVPGRIDLAVDGGVVVGASTEGCDVDVSSERPTWLREACDPTPATDGPDVTGTLRAGPGGDDALAIDVGPDGDEYYQGMIVAPGPDAMVRDASGSPVGPQELAAGDIVRIWTAAGCDESDPVQCEIHAVVVDSADG